MYLNLKEKIIKGETDIFTAVTANIAVHNTGTSLVSYYIFNVIGLNYD